MGYADEWFFYNSGIAYAYYIIPTHMIFMLLHVRYIVGHWPKTEWFLIVLAIAFAFFIAFCGYGHHLDAIKHAEIQHFPVHHLRTFYASWLTWFVMVITHVPFVHWVADLLTAKQQLKDLMDNFS